MEEKNITTMIKNSHIKWISTKPHTKQWLDWRNKTGYGASEIATVVSEYSEELQLLVYKPAIHLHLDRIGEPTPDFVPNEITASGHIMEPIIVNWYKYWDNDNPGWETMNKNMERNNRVNHVICRKQFVTNSKYPWLFASPDGVEYIHNGEHWVKAGIIECKNTTSMEVARYEEKVSPSFVLQVAQALLLSELEYARICIFIDGNKRDVITIYRKDITHIMDAIVKYSKQSWDKVLAARQAKDAYEIQNYYGAHPSQFTVEQLKGVELLHNLEPDFTGTKTELAFIKEMIKPREEDVKEPGSEEQLSLITDKILVGVEESQLAVKKNKNYADILSSLNGSNYIYFNDDEKCYFSYKTDARGVRKIYVSPSLKRFVKE